MQPTQLYVPVRLQQGFQSCLSFIHHTTWQILLHSKGMGTFHNWWYCRNCDTNTRPYFSLARTFVPSLLLLCSCSLHVSPRLICFAIFRVLPPYVYVTVFYHNSCMFRISCGQSHANVASSFAWRRTVQHVALSSKVVGNTTQVWCALSKFH